MEIEDGGSIIKAIINDYLLQEQEEKKRVELERLVDALKTIKECCLEQEDCSSCPIRSPYSPYECGMVYLIQHCRRSPNKWEIEPREWGKTILK